MKKLLAFTLSAVMLLSLTACGGKKDKDPDPTDSVMEETRQPDTPSTPEPTPTPTPEPTPTPTPEPTPTPPRRPLTACRAPTALTTGTL